MSRSDIFPDLFSGQKKGPTGTALQLLANDGRGGLKNVTISPISNIVYDPETGILGTLPTASLVPTVEDLPDPSSFPPEGSLAVVGATKQLYFFSYGYFAWVAVNDLNVNTVFTKSSAGQINLVESSANIALDFSKPNSRMVLNQDVNLVIPNGLYFLNGAAGLEHKLDVWQDPAGGRTISYASWPFEFPDGAPTINPDAFTRSTIKFRASFYAASDVTITNNNPGVVTWITYDEENVPQPAPHNLISGQTVQLISELTPPTGLADNTTYWVNRIDDTTFNLAASLADLQAGTFIDTTGTQEGIYTMTAATIDVYQ